MKKITLLAALLLSAILPASAQITLDWAARTGGPDTDNSSAIALDAQGNVYTTGFFNDSADFDPGPGVYRLWAAGDKDIFISKLDNNGNLLWAIGLGGNLVDAGSAIATDGAGNFYVTGYYSDTVDFDPGPNAVNLVSQGMGDIFVCKFNSGGQLLWAQGIGGAGVNHDIGYSIAVDQSGFAYVVGGFYGTVDFDPGPNNLSFTAQGIKQDLFMLKMDPQGNVVWAQGMGGAEKDQAFSVAVDNAGFVYSTGFFGGTADFDGGPNTFNVTSNGLEDIYITKMDANGGLVWVKTIGIPGTYYQAGIAVTVDVNGDVLTTGSFYDVTDFDPGPNVTNLDAVGGDDIFILKLDSNGDFLWARGMGGLDWDQGYGIATDALGNVYTTGYFRYTVDFDPGAGAFSLSAPGNFSDEIFLLKLDVNGDFLWAHRFGAMNRETGNGIALDGTGHIYYTGSFSQTVNFDPGPGVSNLVSAGSFDAFVCKLTEPLVGMVAHDRSEGVSVFPNPSSGLFRVELAEASQLTVYNTLGEVVYLTQNAQGQVVLDLNAFGNGIYYLKVANARGFWMEKLMLQR